MTPESPRPLEEQFTALLAEYDASLQSGLSPDPADTLSRSPGELRARLDRAQRCLRLLNRAWRRDPAATQLPEAIGRFRIVRELGRGGCGIVFLAVDSALGREVALKVPRLAAVFNAELQARFLREAQASGALDHPNVVPVYEAGQCGETLYIVSAYCPGPTLAAWLRTQPKPVEARVAAELLLTLADAVQHAHSRGILHRDLKPSNILLEDKDEGGRMKDEEDRSSSSFILPPSSLRPRITDFGLAKLLEAEASQTATGLVVGTPAYMAPEQANGDQERVGPPTDVYALGAILYEVLTGRPLFDGANLLGTLQQTVRAEPPPPSRRRPDVHADLDAICRRCVEKEPRRRYPTAAALADDLRQFLNGRPTEARPLTAWQRGGRWLRRRPVFAAACGVAMLGAAAALAVGWYIAVLHDTVTAHTEAVAATEARVAQQQAYAREVALSAASWYDGRLFTQRPVGLTAAAECGFEGRFLRRVAAAELHVGNGHTDAVAWVAFAPDGKLCASAGRDRTIVVWDVAQRTPRYRLTGHHMPLTAVEFSPDGSLLASASGQWPLAGELKLWDVATGTERRTLLVPPRRLIDAVAFSPDGRLLATCGEAQANREHALVWDLASGQSRPLATEPGSYFVPTLAFAPDGKTIAVGYGHHDVDSPILSREGRVQLLDVASGARQAVLKGHRNVVHRVAFTPDGKTLAAGSADDTVTLWDVATRTPRATVPASPTLAFSPDGAMLVTVGAKETQASAYRSLDLWSSRTGAVIARIAQVPVGIRSIRFAPDGSTLAAGCDDGTLRFFDARAVQDLPGHQPAEAWAVALAPDGQTLATGGDDGLVRLWDLVTRRQRAVLPGHTSLVATVAFTPDGRTLITGSFDRTLRLWDAATGRPTATFTGHTQNIRVLAVAPNGQWVASAARTTDVAGELIVWELPTGRRRLTAAAHGTCVACSPDGRLLAYRDGPDTVAVLDARTLTQARLLTDCPAVNCLAFAPDNTTLAIGDSAGLVRLRNAATGAELHTLPAHPEHEVYALSFAPDGKTLASTGPDKTIALWHPATGQELLRFKRLPDYAHALAFAPDSTTLAVACHDGTVRLYQGSGKATP